MSKLTKQQIKSHDTAIRLLNQDRISDEDKLYIFKISVRMPTTLRASPAHFLHRLGWLVTYRSISHISGRKRFGL